jgi:outer membrane protein
MIKPNPLLGAATAVCLLFAGGVVDAAELKIGVVNLAKLFEGLPQARAIDQTLKTAFDGEQRELANMQNELRTLEEKLNRDAAIMSERERSDAERRGRELQRDLQRRASAFQEEVNLRRNEELEKLQRLILREINEFAKAAKYDLVLTDGVRYASPALDITEQIRKRLEAAAPAAPAKPADAGKK